MLWPWAALRQRAVTLVPRDPVPVWLPSPTPPPQVPHSTQSRRLPATRVPSPVRPGPPLAPHRASLGPNPGSCLSIQIVQQLSLPLGPALCQGRRIGLRHGLSQALGLTVWELALRARPRSGVREGPRGCQRPLVLPDLQSPPDHPPAKQKPRLVAEGRVGFPANREGAAEPAVGSGRILLLPEKKRKKGKSLSSCFCFS